MLGISRFIVLLFIAVLWSASSALAAESIQFGAESIQFGAVPWLASPQTVYSVVKSGYWAELSNTASYHGINTSDLWKSQPPALTARFANIDLLQKDWLATFLFWNDELVKVSLIHNYDSSNPDRQLSNFREFVKPFQDKYGRGQMIEFWSGNQFMTDAEYMRAEGFNPIWTITTDGVILELTTTLDYSIVSLMITYEHPKFVEYVHCRTQGEKGKI